MLKVEIRDDLAVFEELAPWWNDQPGPRESLFLRSEWFRTLAATTLGDSDVLRVMVIRDGQDPLAVVPMHRSDRRLKSLTDLSTEAFDMIHGNDDRAIRAAMSELVKPAIVRFTSVVPESPILGMTESNPRWHLDRRIDSAHIDLASGPEGVAAGFSRNLRKNLQRGVRAIEEMGQVHLEVHTDGAKVADAFEASLALEAAGWKGREGVSISDRPARLRFFQELTRVARDLDWLHLGTMSLDGRMIAFSYSMLYAGRLVGILNSYDETLPRKCSPGNVMLWQDIEWASERGAHSVDLGGVSGRNAWKLQWTSQATPRYYITGFGTGATGRVAQFVWRARRGGGSGSPNV